MPTFQQCDAADPAVRKMLNDTIRGDPDYKPLIDAEVKIDLVFAYADKDDDGEPINFALTKGGVRAYGICRKVSKKDQAKGMGDCEIALDGDAWEAMSEKQAAAQLEHELYHIAVRCNDKNQPVMDKTGRPKISMRKHSFEFGWFTKIAEKHGKHSIEVQQAQIIVQKAGQLYFPQFKSLMKESDAP